MDDEDEEEEDEEDAAFVPPPLNTNTNGTNLPVLHGDGTGGYSSGDDSRALLSLERNIANLERSIRRNGGTGSTSKLNKVDNPHVRFNQNDYSDSEVGNLTRSASLDIAKSGDSAKKRIRNFTFTNPVKRR